MIPVQALILVLVRFDYIFAMDGPPIYFTDALRLKSWPVVFMV